MVKQNGNQLLPPLLPDEHHRSVYLHFKDDAALLDNGVLVPTVTLDGIFTPDELRQIVKLAEGKS